MDNYRLIDPLLRNLLGEGPLWSARDNAVYWVDIMAPAVHKYALGEGTVRSWAMPEMIGWVIERDNHPGFIAGFQSGFAELQLDPLSIVPIIDPEPALPGNRMNDAKADKLGRIWAGTMDAGVKLQTGSLYCLDINRTVRRVDSGYRIANGPTLSPDNQHLYHTDSALGRIYRFALDADSHLTDKQTFIQFEADWGKPDGMTTDADGCLWVAHWGTGQVSRFDPAGQRMRSVQLPARQITSCTFAGAALDRMFVTSAADGQTDDPHAGGFFEIDPGVRGLPTCRYAA